MITLGVCHGIVGFELATTHGVGKGVVLQGVAEHILIDQDHFGDVVGHDRLDVFLHIEEGLQFEHSRFATALHAGQCRLGIEHLEAHLENIVLTDAAHLALCLRHLIELLRILQVLFCDVQVLIRQQEVEEQVDGTHGDLFGLGKERCLCLSIAERFDATIPLQCVYTKEWLAQC